VNASLGIVDHVIILRTQRRGVVNKEVVILEL